MFKQIIDAVSQHFDITYEEMHNSKTRERAFVLPRQVGHYFLHKKTKLTLSEIGKKIGGKDHATVLHSCKTIRNLIQTDRDFAKEIEEIESNINY